MGQAIEALLNAIAQALGIEAAKFALGDLFPFIVVTGVVWFGAIISVFWIVGLVLPKREWHEDTPMWEQAVSLIAFAATTIVVIGGGLYLFLTGF